MLPYSVVNIDISEFFDLDFRFSEPTVVRINWDGYRYDLLINYVSSSNRFVAFGSGAANRSKINPPFFARHSWYHDLEAYTSIWYSDPTFFTGDLNLYWYYGEKTHWPLFRYSFLIFEIAKKLGLDCSESLFYGSSGGGFSSLVLATILRAKASVVNPQVSVLSYNPTYFQRFSNEKFKTSEDKITHRLSFLELIDHESYIPDIFYLQNTVATRDVTKHFIPCIKKYIALGEEVAPLLQIRSYSHPSGHSGMPDKDMCLQDITAGLEKDNSGLVLTERNDNYTYFDRLMLSVAQGNSGYKMIQNFEKPANLVEAADIDIEDGIMKCTIRTIIPEDKLSFAFYVYKNEEVIHKQSYGASNVFSMPLETGEGYRIRCFLKFPGESKGFVDVTFSV